MHLVQELNASTVQYLAYAVSDGVTLVSEMR